jgi:hypothetical protein
LTFGMSGRSIPARHAEGSLMTESRSGTPKILDMAIVTIILVAAFAFFVIALNTRDLLWFWPTYDELPRQMIVHCYGSDVEVEPGAAFEAVNGAVNETLSGSKRWDQLTMSEETYQEYQDSPTMMVLELVYDPAARIHSFYSFYKNVTRMVIPLDGRHASTNAIFGRLGDFNLSGSFHVESNAPILEAVQANGICQMP